MMWACFWLIKIPEKRIHFPVIQNSPIWAHPCDSLNREMTEMMKWDLHLYTEADWHQSSDKEKQLGVEKVQSQFRPQRVSNEGATLKKSLLLQQAGLKICNKIREVLPCPTRATEEEHDVQKRSNIRVSQQLSYKIVDLESLCLTCCWLPGSDYLDLITWIWYAPPRRRCNEMTAISSFISNLLLWPIRRSTFETQTPNSPTCCRNRKSWRLPTFLRVGQL